MEKAQIDKKMNFYLETFNTLKGAVGDAQLAGEAAIAILHEAGKDARCEMMNAHGTTERNGYKKGNGFGGDETEPASEKQIGFLKSLGVAIKPGLTKREASALIDGKTQKA